jgi:hypothetical protein
MLRIEGKSEGGLIDEIVLNPSHVPTQLLPVGIALLRRKSQSLTTGHIKQRLKVLGKFRMS